MKKLFKLITLFIILNPNIVNAYIKKEKTLNFIDDLYISIKKIDDNYLYSFDNNKFIPYEKELKVVDFDNIYYTYIIKNGYPNKNITGNNEIDYYITQISIFLLNDYLNNINDDQNGVLSKEIKQNDSSIITKAKSLAQESINQKILDPKLEIVKINDSFNKFKLIDDTNRIVSYKIDAFDLNYNKKNTFNINEYFLSNLKNIKIKYKYKNSKLTYYTYDNTYQNLICSKLKEEIEENTLDKNIENIKEVDKQVNNVIINNVDINKNKIQGSTFLIKDENKNVINKIITTKNLDYFTLNKGKYYIKQIDCDNKYLLYDKDIEFNVTDSLTKINIVNEVNKTNIKAGYIDEYGKYVKDMNLVIKDYDGNIIKKLKTKNEPLNINLNTGAYTLVINNSKLNFKVLQDGKTNVLKLGAYLKAKLPNISNLNNYHLYIGLIILLSGIGIVIYEKI